MLSRTRRSLDLYVTQSRSPRHIRRRIEGCHHNQQHHGLAMSGNVATVYGGGGFLGGSLVPKLVDAGIQCIVPHRNGQDRRYLLATGANMVSLPDWDPRVESEYERTMRPSNIVICCIGNNYPVHPIWRKPDLSYGKSAVHSNIPRMIARYARKMDVERFVYVSALNASPDHPSEVLRRKYETEIAVRQEFPEATIIRPSLMIGWQDWYTTMPAIALRYRVHLTMPGIPIIDGGQQLHAPVTAGDVARGIALCLRMEHTIGQTVEMCGPVVHHYADVSRWLAETLMYEHHPWFLTKAEALRFFRMKEFATKYTQQRANTLWGQELVHWLADDWVPRTDSTALTFTDLGLAPEDLQIMENVAFSWLISYRTRNWTSQFNSL
eukprot:TRINITY_DN72795_c0_g1_i1.p2 TRINITY_DN72795_c0_g1~~TRINITY_DN72795_c0_g1_i1.p2  ORF type:complete len:380 (-),score=59.31 TRINITY_DN72795_c0_g1_i1:405-1544(-)